MILIIDDMKSRNGEIEKHNSLISIVDFSIEENLKTLYDVFSFYFFQNLLGFSDLHHISGYLLLNEEELRSINYQRLNNWSSFPQKIINNSYDKGRLNLDQDFFDSNMIYSLDYFHLTFPITVCFFYNSKCIKSSLYYHFDESSINIVPKTFVYNNRIILEPITYIDKYKNNSIKINANCSTLNAERLLNLFKYDILTEGFQNSKFKILNVSDCIGKCIKVSDGFLKGSHFEFQAYKSNHSDNKLIYFKLNW